TQAYVHLACLRRWQWAVMASRHPGTNYTPALVCSVCTQRFSVAPPRLSVGLRLLRLIEFYSRELTGFFVFLITCYVLLVFHMEFASLIFQLHSLLHTISRTLWREGASVSVHPGMLLVASPSMPMAASIFYQSVDEKPDGPYPGLPMPPSPPIPTSIPYPIPPPMPPMGPALPPPSKLPCPE
ncbi:unnamed protein product, partial [Closterium sp. Naga37s-1]